MNYTIIYSDDILPRSYMFRRYYIVIFGEMTPKFI